MNLAQMRTMLRSILTAGGGANQGIGTDDFWADKELNTYLNMAQLELYKIIRRARSDYFTRIVRTTDAPFLVRGVLFDPSSLRWQAGQGNYTLPPDFVRMKLITDLSGDPCRVTHGDIARNEFKIIMNQRSGQMGGEYLYDILGVKTLLIRPIPDGERDFEFIYEYSLPPLRDYKQGAVTYTENNTTMSFSDDAKIQNYLVAGDEIIPGVDADNQSVPVVDHQYPVIRSIDSPNQVTLESPYILKEAE